MAQDNQAALEAVFRLRKDELVGGEFAVKNLAGAFAAEAAHLPESELRSFADSVLARPAYAAAFLKPGPPPNPVAEAVARSRSHASPVGFGIDQAGAFAPLPAPPFAEYQPVDPAAPEPIDLNARSLYGHMTGLNAVSRSGITPFGKAR